MQGVELAARLGMDLLDRRPAGRADRVDRFGQGGHGGDNDNRHGCGSFGCDNGVFRLTLNPATDGSGEVRR
ncbi:hypothetical protein MFAL_04010 [Mycolicibacterium fallax]|nr:hypothetical protein MFAL_04010 [Mycolicibacterium fallax]